MPVVIHSATLQTGCLRGVETASVLVVSTVTQRGGVRLPMREQAVKRKLRDGKGTGPRIPTVVTKREGGDGG